jgi:hypothetical protein
MAGARADLAEDLLRFANNVKRIKGEWANGELPAQVNLDADIAALGKIIDGGQLNEAGLAVALYYRADASLLYNAWRLKTNQPVDVAAARSALADYDRVIARGKDIADWGVEVSNAAYSAGWVAKYHLSSMPLAYSYWEKCADHGHAGCMSTMAAAHVSGAGAVKVDLKRALDLNARVYAAGLSYGCAGAYAARDNGMILYFGDVTHRPAEELEWLSRSRGVLDELGKTQKMRNPCNRAKFEAIEYLVRYSQGDDRKPLLKVSLELAESPEDKAIGRYLAGTMGDEEYNATIAKSDSKYAMCQMHFLAMWTAEINRNRTLSGEHLAAMKEIGPEFCGTELTYARKFRR